VARTHRPLSRARCGIRQRRSFSGTRRSANGLNGTTLFAHIGGDVGESGSWRAGASWLDLRAEERTYEDVDALGNAIENAFTGDSRTWIVDATYKWNRPGDPLRRSLKLQGEYMSRTENGDLAFDVTGAALTDRYRSEQDGWYVQGVYQFRPRWRAGARYDALDSGTPEIGLVESGALTAEDFALLSHATPSRTSLMLDWNPSEFSRLRAQISWDDARNAATDEQFFLQYIYSLGVPRRPQVLGDPAMINFARCCLMAALAITGSAHAAVRILATTADWGALASELGGDKVDVYYRHQCAAGRAPRRCQAQPRSRAPAMPTSWSPTAPSSRSAGCRCCCRNQAIRRSARNAGLFRGDGEAEADRGADGLRPLDGRHTSARQPARAA
jgi:hypothetical protein